MKEVFVSYASHSSWANGSLLSLITSLSPEQQKQEIRSSFSSLYATVLHLLDAESIWWQRLKLQEGIVLPSDSFNGDMMALSTALQKVDREWQDWVAQASEPMLQHEFIYQNTKRESFKQPVWQMLLHLFNHNTYHRGQLVTMLRQVGVEKIPATDYIVWCRK